MISKPDKKHTITQGNYLVTQNSAVILSTVLGSCVGTCIYDPVLQVGGMNHFLLPGNPDTKSGYEDQIFGIHLMELLLNDLFAYGVVKNRLKVKLFGGARMSNLTSDPGKKNADFILKFVEDEGLDVVSSSLRGDHGRRIEFHPFTGRVRQKLLIDNFSEVEENTQAQREIQTGHLELF